MLGKIVNFTVLKTKFMEYKSDKKIIRHYGIIPEVQLLLIFASFLFYDTNVPLMLIR